ncbi:MAG: ABC transporter permease [Firmicutes bacterium]|nr:ABC transporter permease [Bacillota bacterium]
MKSYDLLVLANRNLWRRKGRTILTILGVIIGTTAIVVMLSLGIGLVESQKNKWNNGAA